MMLFDKKSLMFPSQFDHKIQQVCFIVTTREHSVNGKDLWAPTLVGPLWLYQGSGPCSCNTHRQSTMYSWRILLPKKMKTNLKLVFIGVIFQKMFRKLKLICKMVFTHNTVIFLKHYLAIEIQKLFKVWWPSSNCCYNVDHGRLYGGFCVQYFLIRFLINIYIRQ